MAKGDSSGIAQQGAQLNPNARNRFGNPNGMPPQAQGIAGPPPGVMEMLMQMLMGQSKPGGQIGQVKSGIDRLRGNNKPEMNKNAPRAPMPQSRAMPQPQMMPGGGQFMLPQPRMMDPQGMGNVGGFNPVQASAPPMMGNPGMNQPAQLGMGNPQLEMLQQMMAGGGRRFV